MSLAKSTKESRNWLRDMLVLTVGVVVIALAVVFFQNLDAQPQQTEVTKEIKIK